MRFKPVGERNVAVGPGSLYSTASDQPNNAFGATALVSNGVGNFNNAFGHFALKANTTGLRNVGLGAGALKHNTTRSDNIALGNDAGSLPVSGVNTIRLGRQGAQLKTFIVGIRSVTVSGGAAVMGNSLGQLGVQRLSRRFKKDIAPIGAASAALLKLRPVAFRYGQADGRGQHPMQHSLIAEAVARVMPDLVVYGQDGKPATVAYQTLSRLLLNEFQIEHARHANDHDKLAALAAQTRAQAVQLTSVHESAARREQQLISMQRDLAQLRQLTQQLVATRPSSASVAISQS